MSANNTAEMLIERLGLQPHPEGGWYKETWRAPASDGERSGATAIHFLLEASQHSHWHKVDASEIWLWHSGDPLLLSLAPEDHGPVQDIRLGIDVMMGEQTQHVIPPHWWQAARPIQGGQHGYSLLSCIVSPAFQFEGFVLAESEWAPGH